MPIPFRDLAGLPPARAAALAEIVATQISLERVVMWGYSLEPTADISNVVIQDEFTHDVLLPLGDGTVLVYDTT